MIKSPVSAFVGPVPAAFMRRFTFVVGAFLPAIDGCDAGARTLMDERQKHPAPTAEPTRAGAQRRFRAGASTALSLRESFVRQRRPSP